MRNEDEIISDLFELSSFQWNSKLAEEFNFDLPAMITAVNDYSYTVPSEDSIHNSGRLTRQRELVNTISSESFTNDSNTKDLITNIDAICGAIATTRRSISNVSIDYGYFFRNYVFFGICFNDMDMPGIIFDGCVFSNCIFDECLFSGATFTGCRFLECEYDECDFAGSDFNKCALFGVNFINCAIEDATYADCVQHNVSYTGSELDNLKVISGSMHRVDIDTSSLKRASICCVIFSVSKIMNSNLRNIRLTNNKFIGCGFNMLHVDAGIQSANSFLGCDIPSDLEDFFHVDEYEEINEENDDDSLGDRGFDDIMGDDEDD